MILGYKIVLLLFAIFEILEQVGTQGFILHRIKIV